jgi:hypothetical protein
MTVHKHLKQLVRARMTKTGERYAAARRHVLRDVPQPPADPASRWHFPGCVPATTALRVLLAHAGVRAPHTGQPFSEALLFAVAGGVGAGMFTFFYEKEGFASFFIAGRHGWRDDLAYFHQACGRFGITPVVRESSGAKTADRQLGECLADSPCVAWVEGYRVVIVYRIDAAAGTALIGDLADDPIPMPLADLAKTRGRIKKQKNRLLSVPASPSSPDLAPLVREGLRACHEGLTKGPSNFTLETFRKWAERMHGSKDKESWERIFTPGPRLWNGLTSIYTFIEHYGTGGGLCRPLMADGLREAADALGRPALRSLADRYAELGRGWSDLADAALPDDVPALKEAKKRCARQAEQKYAGFAASTEGSCANWVGVPGDDVRAKFPLTEAECADLRAGLQTRIRALYDAERAAAAALDETINSL